MSWTEKDKIKRVNAKLRTLRRQKEMLEDIQPLQIVHPELYHISTKDAVRQAHANLSEAIQRLREAIESIETNNPYAGQEP